MAKIELNKKKIWQSVWLHFQSNFHLSFTLKCLNFVVEKKNLNFDMNADVCTLSEIKLFHTCNFNEFNKKCSTYIGLDFFVCEGIRQPQNESNKEKERRKKNTIIILVQVTKLGARVYTLFIKRNAILYYKFDLLSTIQFV